MAINRAPFNGLVDDDGSNTIGTIWNKAQIQGTILDPADTAIAHGAAAARTDTGTVHNWNLSLAGHALTRWAGASDLVITGLTGGVNGQVWTLRNTGAAVISLAHLNASSATANQFRNLATSWHTPVGPGGWVHYVHDGTSWTMVGHDSGGWITPAYNGAAFTSNVGSWTVDAGDVTTYAYRLSGKTMTVSWYLQATSVAGTPTVLRILIPGTFTAAKASLHPVVHDDAGVGNAGTFGLLSASSTLIEIYKAYGAGSFANATNTTRLFGTVTFEVN